MAKPRKFKPEFKAKIALAALRGDQPVAALCRQHALADSVISRWKQQLLDGAVEIFSGQTPAQREETRIAGLERLLGQLTVELAAAKKLSKRLD